MLFVKLQIQLFVVIKVIVLSACSALNHVYAFVLRLIYEVLEIRMKNINLLNLQESILMHIQIDKIL